MLLNDLKFIPLQSQALNFVFIHFYYVFPIRTSLYSTEHLTNSEMCCVFLSVDYF